ncbi:MAG TPA: 4Fe-4S binding protein [Halobacteria archaeon]|nr:4Fe-4S binding protein [Halobacteria archaeon]
MANMVTIAVLDCRCCGKCDSICPYNAIEKENKKTRINYDRCTGCLKCVEICPNRSIVVMD